MGLPSEGGLSGFPISGTALCVGAKKTITDTLIARLTAGVRSRIAAALEPGEKQADFLRAAIERELQWRETARARSSGHVPRK